MYHRANTMLEIRPADFWELTPVECGALVAGAASREERAWERAALIASYAVNPHLKEWVTPDQILGRKKPIEVIDPGAKEAELARRLDALGLRKED